MRSAYDVIWHIASAKKEAGRWIAKAEQYDSLPIAVAKDERYSDEHVGRCFRRWLETSVQTGLNHE